MPKFVGSSFMLLSLFSCQGRKPVVQPNTKDSVVNKYLRLVDSSGDADTNDLKYKILKGYIHDDSSFFSNLDRNLDIYRRQREEEQQADSCVQAVQLSAQDFEEAYRFCWAGAFCRHRLMITIGRQRDGVLLRFVEYESSPDTGIPCLVTRRAQKLLPEAAWEHLVTTVDFAYFWSMEPQDDKVDTEGSAWKLEGYQARDGAGGHPRSHCVYRQSPGVRAFSAIGFEMLKLSGQKTHCFY
ncbi:MAG: hypothetical protein JST39_04915 [Bacteroidetes bacterium]|nr:hypothetical protein [Bacteroidota bacterium]